MNKFRILSFSLIITMLICTFSGCGLSYLKNQEKIYLEKVEAFFDALEKEDVSKIKSLFTQEVIENDTDLDDEIAKMISAYPEAETTIITSSLPHMQEIDTDEKGRTVYTPGTCVPVICDDEYYWVYIELIYIEGRPLDSIAIKNLYFYTADEYYIRFREDSPTDTGLLVFADQTLNEQIVCINTIPLVFDPIDRVLDLNKVKDFLKSSKDFNEFKEEFGLPNATNRSDYYYEIPNTKESLKYLLVRTENDNITKVGLVDASGDYWKAILDK